MHHHSRFVETASECFPLDSNPPCATSLHSFLREQCDATVGERERDRSASVLNGDLIRLAGVEERERARQSIPSISLSLSLARSLFPLNSFNHDRPRSYAIFRRFTSATTTTEFFPTIDRPTDADGPDRETTTTNEHPYLRTPDPAPAPARRRRRPSG